VSLAKANELPNGNVFLYPKESKHFSFGTFLSNLHTFFKKYEIEERAKTLVF
jgi:hypothetical protein